MDFYALSAQTTLKTLKSDADNGLTINKVEHSKKQYGTNTLKNRKKRTLASRVLSALKEPMLLILIFGFILCFGTNLGKYLKTGEGDFTECLGIVVAVILSVSITLIMESSSEKAFLMLNGIYENIAVKAIRNGKTILLSHKEVVVGDILLVESGDKIVADGRIIQSNGLTVDESTLTGESLPAKKDGDKVYDSLVAVADRANCLYSGTFVASGNAKMVVTAVGNNTEIGKIAGELGEKEGQSPLQHKLGKLGKTITVIGSVSALIVFVFSIVRMYFSHSLDFTNVQELFVSCIVLIVAAVPEGLPTIVAVSLALNMIKLAKGNALIKKMTATETAGAVSVICSDKTGTLTKNKMTVISVCKNNFCTSPDKVKEEVLLQNFVCNSTAQRVKKNSEWKNVGSATECALLSVFNKNYPERDIQRYRKGFEVLKREPFSGEKKYMITTVKLLDKNREFIKGAPESVLDKCNLSGGQIRKLLKEMEIHQKKARRVLCFAHMDYVDNRNEKYEYDGFVAIADPIRPEVEKAVRDCKRAGIEVKILTGDNIETAYAIARELNIASSENQVISAQELEELDDETFKKILKKITVIARSTPMLKLRVVKALKSMGEIVAVTGDGINDAPAIKNADVGIAMGVTGSEITKESADVILLDDSFATVVKAISFGRNVYKNIQRFILFQLSVNLSALLFITVCAILGLKTPFNTLQLLWINVIMDGPPAITLGLESVTDGLMNLKPVNKGKSIVSLKMLLRILFNGIFVGVVMLMQYIFDFLKVGIDQQEGVIFTLFIFFQLFNAFNCRELGSESIFKSIGKNKVMVITFMSVMVLHVFMVQVFPSIFGVNALGFLSYVKCLAVSTSVLAMSEGYKFIYRLLKRDKNTRVQYLDVSMIKNG